MLVGGRSPDPDDPDALPSRNPVSRRALLVTAAAAAAVAATVAVPALRGNGDGETLGSENGGAAWTGVQICRTEPAGGCVERDAAVAAELAGLLLPLRPAPTGTSYCLAIGERFEVTLRRPQDPPPVLLLDTACGPLRADGTDHARPEGAAEAVARAWSA